MQDKFLECLATLRHDQESDCLSMGDESFLNGVPTGEDLLVLAKKPRRWRVQLPDPGSRDGRARPRCWGLIAARAGSVVGPGRPTYEGQPRGRGLSVNLL